MSDLFQLFSMIIAGGSLVVSGVSLVLSYRNQRRIVQIEEQREHDRQLSALKASLRPELRKTSSGSCRLYLVNSGMAAARNVSVELDGKPLCDHPAAVQGSEMPSLVGPNSEVSCALALTFGCNPPFEIEVRWDDDAGAGHVYRGALTF